MGGRQQLRRAGAGPGAGAGGGAADEAFPGLALPGAGGRAGRCRHHGRGAGAEALPERLRAELRALGLL
ncbi:hypothetical protein ACFQU2_15000 [Siccirubricoccus deserti]